MTRTTVTKTRKATTRPTQRVRSVVEAPPEGERGGCAGGRGVTVSVPYSTIELSPAARERQSARFREVSQQISSKDEL